MVGEPLPGFTGLLLLVFLGLAIQVFITAFPGRNASPSQAGSGLAIDSRPRPSASGDGWAFPAIADAGRGDVSPRTPASAPDYAEDDK